MACSLKSTTYNESFENKESGITCFPAKDEPIAHGFLEYNSILDLGEIVAEKHKGRILPTDITLYKSLGMGLLDVSVAKSVYNEALIKGVGLEIPVLS